MKAFFSSVMVVLTLLANNAAQAVDTPVNAVGDEAPNVVLSEQLRSARGAVKAKDWRKAISELETVLRNEPRNADVHNLLGYSYRRQATPDLAKAFEHYKTALTLNPRHLGAHEYIGEAYLMDKKPAEAQRHLAQIEGICGNRTCEEYVDLSQALAAYKGVIK